MPSEMHEGWVHVQGLVIKIHLRAAEGETSCANVQEMSPDPARDRMYLLFILRSGHLCERLFPR